MPTPFHAFCLSAPHSGGGKTTVALALMRAFLRKGFRVQGFKCGPDYIDPSFHRQAAKRPSFNLDTWMMGEKGVQHVWTRKTADADIAICEGVMGLFDSRSPGDMKGSTADCALALDIPVILVVHVKGMAGSLAPIVAGYRDFHPRLRLAGIIANGVGSRRHADILAAALERESLPPLLGALPFNREWILPERQLGLVPAEEAGRQETWFDMIGTSASEWIDLDKILELTLVPRPHPQRETLPHPPEIRTPQKKRMGIAKDEAFCFYYDENLEYLKQRNWELIEFSPIHDSNIPERLDALYLGGGYPEIFARQLADNASMKASIREFALSGKEVFAECGGYMYLGKTLITQTGEKYSMCGVINGTSAMGSKLRSLGYREAAFRSTETPWNLPCSIIRGHEFHWSQMELHEHYPPLYSYEDKDNSIRHEGVCHKNIKAGYIHLYWARTPEYQSNEKQSDASPRFEGRVLLLNGASSSGKTSLAHEFRRLASSPVMVFSIDLFLLVCGTSNQSVTETINDTGLPLVEAFHASITAAARAGAFVIVDHVIGENDAWFQDLKMRLGSVPLKTVKVLCRKEILTSRETSRTDRKPDILHALRQEQSIHEGIAYDLEIDTSENSPDSCARQLIRKLDQSNFFSQSIPSIRL